MGAVAVEECPLEIVMLLVCHDAAGFDLFINNSDHPINEKMDVYLREQIQQLKLCLTGRDDDYQIKSSFILSSRFINKLITSDPRHQERPSFKAFCDTFTTYKNWKYGRNNNELLNEVINSNTGPIPHVVPALFWLSYTKLSCTESSASEVLNKQARLTNGMKEAFSQLGIK